MAQILLIEPDAQLAKTYSHALESAGHKVLISATAQGGIFAADEVRPDLILLEVQLIEHSGIEFLYELRSYPEWQGIPVVIHSSVPPGEFSHNETVLREQLGVAHYLYKPHTTLKALLSSVAEFALVTS